MLVFWMIARVASLTGERIMFHAVGDGLDPWVTASSTYGGAALLLWLAAWMTGQAVWVPGAWLPSVAYAGSFWLYIAALSRGPVSQVSPVANVSLLVAFFVRPSWSVMSVSALVLFAVGLWWLVPKTGRLSPAVWWMLLSDGGLVWGRLLDSRLAAGGPVLAYAATLYSGVTLVFLAGTLIRRQGFSLGRVWRQRGASLAGASFFNGFSYLTVVMLLGYLPPSGVEAVSAIAGITGTWMGALWFHEEHVGRRVLAAVFMTAGAFLLILHHVQNVPTAYLPLDRPAFFR